LEVVEISKQLIKDITRIIDSGQMSPFFMNFNGGPHVRRFERAFANYVGTRYAFSMSNGTVALNAAYNALCLKASSLYDMLRGSDAVIITVAHREFKSVDSIQLKKLAQRGCVIFDGPRLFDPSEILKLGLTFCVGNTTFRGVRE